MSTPIASSTPNADAILRAIEARDMGTFDALPLGVKLQLMFDLADSCRRQHEYVLDMMVGKGDTVLPLPVAPSPIPPRDLPSAVVSVPA